MKLLSLLKKMTFPYKISFFNLMSLLLKEVKKNIFILINLLIRSLNILKKHPTLSLTLPQDIKIKNLAIKKYPQTS